MRIKPFKTYREQLDILKSKNLTIDDEDKAIRILSDNNYYNLINGYKRIFLDKNASGEKYIDGATLNEVYSLYCMDSELKNSIFKYILKFEKILKSHLSYEFASMYREDYSYLQMKNYSSLEKDLDLVLKNLSTLSNLINRERKSKNRRSIKHYADRYSSIPIWVLVNSLTLGNISYFYMALTDKLKNNIAKKFSLAYAQDYAIDIRISSEMIIDLLKLATFFRNIAAHDEVMFSFHLMKTGKLKSFNKYLEDNYTGKTFFDLVLALKLVISKEEYDELILEIKLIFDKYRESFMTINFDDILSMTGFSNDFNLWESQIIDEDAKIESEMEMENVSLNEDE